MHMPIKTRRKTTRPPEKQSREKKPALRPKTPNLLTLFPEFTVARYRKTAGQQREQFLKELRDAYLHNGLALYVGAGVSRSVGLPSWPELIRSLTVTMMTRRLTTAISLLEHLSDEEKYERLFQLQEEVKNKTDPDKPILMMARAIKDDLGDRLPTILARNLYRPVSRYASRIRSGSKGRSRFAETIPRSPLMDAIVSLTRAERDITGVQAIINYNFDDLLDEHLRAENVRCKTVVSGRDSVPAGTLPCYHVHGIIPFRPFAERREAKPLGSFVFSEDEYHAEYSDPYKWSNMTQMSHLGRYTGLFVGLSMEDPNLRRIVDVTHRQYPEILNYAILPRRSPLAGARDSKETVLRNLFELVESVSFERIGVRVIWVDVHEEVAQVVNQICGLGVT
jgi:hypothetical protein